MTDPQKISDFLHVFLSKMRKLQYRKKIQFNDEKI